MTDGTPEKTADPMMIGRRPWRRLSRPNQGAAKSSACPAESISATVVSAPPLRMM